MTVLTGVGLGLRRDFIDSFLNLDTYPDFIEVAPENWMGFGGRHAKLLAQFRGEGLCPLGKGRVSALSQARY